MSKINTKFVLEMVGRSNSISASKMMKELGTDKKTSATDVVNEIVFQALRNGDKNKIPSWKSK